jgi:RNA polymerase II subunit A small phosphatase-like protein
MTSQKDRLLLILDLDRTLVYASELPLPREHDFRVEKYYVYRRPGLESFVSTCDSLFDLAVWSSSAEVHAKEIVSRLFPSTVELKFLWSRERCSRREDPELGRVVWIKDLKNVEEEGYDLDRVLVVDDSAKKLDRSYENLVTVKPFSGSPDDMELVLLAEFLRSLASAVNVRPIEKRDWRPTEPL